jgi:prolyl 4-hydroxylase
MKPGKKQFLLWDYIDDLSLCDRIIDHFNTTEKKGPGLAGRTSAGRKGILDKQYKDSTDSILDLNKELFEEYKLQLESVVKKYIKKFKYCNIVDPWGLLYSTNIQHYAPGQGFKQWHTERIGILEPANSRHLVFMTYLNDVHDEGQTEWFYQKIKLTPRKGLTAIWPADWTYTHRGIVSKTEHKYIVTGWFNFYTEKF